ncbi:MAG TPA: ABC transporter permease [Lacunisphaera sp.]|nr:ABC transporter permease [Lacunisphaera sp.]
MAAAIPAQPARVEASREGETMVLRIGGDWRMAATHPVWADTVVGDRPARVVLQAAGLGSWDSSLALFVSAARAWAGKHGVPLEEQGIPAGAAQLARLLGRKPAKPPAKPRGLPNLFAFVGKATVAVGTELKNIAWLVGECAFSGLRFFRGRAQFRWSDCFIEMQECGAMVLPIVGLISFLVGIIMAYQGAVQLRQFGADIYVADLVGLSVVREMGPMMAAIVLAGRTGAAFAATLATMKANEEIDALETLGVSPVDFLVMPRLTALFLMMPLLAVYSNCLGILGGMVISWSILDIPTSLYWAETKSIIDLSDLSTGLIKAATFGVIIGLSGCLRGLKSDRSAAGVGQAATSAVVTGILLIIVSDAIYAVIFNALGW